MEELNEKQTNDNEPFKYLYEAKTLLTKSIQSRHDGKTGRIALAIQNARSTAQVHTKQPADGERLIATNPYDYDPFYKWASPMLKTRNASACTPNAPALKNC